MQTKDVSWEENLKNLGDGPYVKIRENYYTYHIDLGQRSRIGVEGVA